MTYGAAITFCKEKNSTLIEIDSLDQKDFIFEKLQKISGEVKWQTPPGRKYKAWWAGATDEEEEGTWRWTQSGEPVQDFMWGGGEPNNAGNGEDYFCFIKGIPVESDNDEGPYKGNDCSGSSRVGYPLCQKKNSTTEDHDSPVPIPEIVGGSVAGLVLIIVIMAVAVWCRRKQNSKVVIENNEMYGPPSDYDQYDKDAYDTKVLDNNDYYYES